MASKEYREIVAAVRHTRRVLTRDIAEQVAMILAYHLTQADPAFQTVQFLNACIQEENGG